MNEPTMPPPAAFTGQKPVSSSSSAAPGPATSQASPQPPRPARRTSSFQPGGPAIPVVLNEAALDSPSFRATAVHFSDQLDTIERWLDGYARSTAKLAHDVLALEDTINAYLSKISPPPSMASPADSPVLDADYTLPALRRAGEGAREWWGGILAAVRRLEPVSVEPIRAFIQNELRNFRETRRALDAAQKAFDGTLARYVGQSKTKEPSSLREDAFAVYETRRAYLKASMDYCQMAPQVRAGLDRLLVRICADVYREMRKARESGGGAVSAWGDELERIRGWAREMESSEAVFRRELQAARREIGESTLTTYKPSRELEDYSISTVPYLGSKGPMSMQRKDQVAVISEKQGWLFLRVLSGKPVRTTWVRRWYYCRDGIFGWLAQGPHGVLMGDEIGVLLCSARPAVQEERRFCFEIKTKTQTIMLQAETQAQLIEWLEVFEVAKKKAIEASMGRDQSALLGGVDPAFSITPPSIPEFSAKNLDNLDETATSEKQANLPLPSQEGNLATRTSFDVPPRRAITTHLGREDGESGREHAARIMQKLDLHRKSTFASSSETSALGVAAAGLVSATAASPLLGQTAPLRLSTPLFDQQPGSLAPVALAKPPIMTSLSKAAVLASANAGTGQMLPSAVLANYWGSCSYTPMYCPSPTMPPTPKPDPTDPFVATVMPGTTTGEKMAVPASSHRKTLSMDTKMTDIKAQEKSPSDKFPLNYPSELRAQYAQFRLIFPTAPIDDKPVLVLNAAWSSSSGEGKEGQGMAGSGRIFVTPDRMYFYGHQLGLVVAYAIDLDSIAELTAAPGRDCNFIFLHLNQDMQDARFSRVTIKVFLEDFSLLQARLNLLVDDLQAAEPMELSEIIRALINLEKAGQEHNKRSPSADSWEEVSSNTPVDDGTPFGRPVNRRPQLGNGRYGLLRGSRKSVPKLQLPARPVVYEPQDMGKAVAERHFEISAKACFHVLFGDNSFLFPKLYFERRAKEIAQGPWELQDQGRMRRQFRFKVDHVDMLGRKKAGDVTDSQTIDVFNDHITYVVTHTKTPWHLPHSQAFRLVFKVVITHVSKSRCRLAIYTKADWSKAAAFAKNMVQRQALDDAANDAEELAELATEQVRRLGPHSRTKRAIQVYGNIGQQNQVVTLTPDTAAAEGQKKPTIRPRTLTDMMLETGRSFMESAITSIMMWTFAALKRLFKIVTANRVILVLLAVSAAYNLLVISQASSTWLLERRSARYMNRLGVGPNPIMSKAIYLADLEEAAAAGGRSAGLDARPSKDSQCYTTFQTLVNTTSLDAPYQDAGADIFSSAASRATARRLRRARQRLGGYRHDLLVAMRIVNGIEREVVQSEWENWLADETYRCEQVKGMLMRGDLGREEVGDVGEEGKGKDRYMMTEDGDGDGQQKVLTAKDGGKRKEALRKWHEEYCGSCEADRKAVLERRGVSEMASFVM